MAESEFAPVTPGEMLKEEFLAEYGLSQNQLAKAIGISPNRITEIVNNRRRITADSALRLSLYFGNSPEFWMNLQIHYDLKKARLSLKPEDAKRIKARWAFGGNSSSSVGRVARTARSDLPPAARCYVQAERMERSFTPAVGSRRPVDRSRVRTD